MSPRSWSSRPNYDGLEWAREPRYSQSLERGLAILKCFTPERPVLGITDIADELGMSRSTTHRYVVTLVALGYLEQGKSRKYRLSLKVTDLGMGVLNGTGLGDNANLHMRTLVQRANFTCSLAALDGTDITIMEHVTALRRGYPKSAWPVEIGSRLPAAVTATGKLLLAYLPDAEQDGRLAEITLKLHGPNTITSKAKLRSEFVAIREFGIATNDEELEPGFCAIAAPVRDQSREVFAALNLLAPVRAIALPNLVNALKSHLIATADQISARLGYRLEVPENGQGHD